MGNGSISQGVKRGCGINLAVSLSLVPKLGTSGAAPSRTPSPFYGLQSSNFTGQRSPAVSASCLPCHSAQCQHCQCHLSCCWPCREYRHRRRNALRRNGMCQYNAELVKHVGTYLVTSLIYRCTRSIPVPVVWYGCQTWSVIIRNNVGWGYLRTGCGGRYFSAGGRK
jgi:hypothetical protein